jgi:hypothetical protein
VGKPGLVGPVWLPIPGDLAVHTLVGLADPLCDVLDSFTPVKPIGDLDAVVLCQIAGTYRCVNEAHAASVDEPQRPTAERHSHRLCRHRTGNAGSNQFEVSALDTGRHLVRRVARHCNPIRPGFATIVRNFRRSRGRVCQAVISSTTRSVIRLMVSLDTWAP